MAVKVITKLINRHNGVCHYCFSKTNRNNGSPRQATKDHVVPRAFGGINNLDNYVLACSECNNRRGTTLFFCACEFCVTRIQTALASEKFIDHVFQGIINHNRARVYYQPECQRWCVRIGHTRRHYATWTEAMNVANTGHFDSLKGN